MSMLNISHCVNYYCLKSMFGSCTSVFAHADAPPFTVWPWALAIFSFKLLSIFSWSHHASLFTSWWRPWLNRRRGTGWGRPWTAPKQRTSSNVWPSGPSERPFCCLLLASDRSWCSEASSQNGKVLLRPPLRTQRHDAPPDRWKCYIVTQEYFFMSDSKNVLKLSWMSFSLE